MSRALLFLALLAAVFTAGAGTPARAGLNLCNRTSYILYTATAARQKGQTLAQGWTRIVPGECQMVRKEPLTAQGYLVHARSGIAHSGPSRAWGGAVQTCVKDGNFQLQQPVGQFYCTADGTFSLPFAAVDTHGQHNWTMTFDETPALASLDAAQLAGVKRLLLDNGFRIAAITGQPDKQTGLALNAFRYQMHLPARAGNAELFTALENRALRRVAPAGYTVCNHGKDALLLALAQSGRGKPVSRGWWTVQAGGCAKLSAEPLATDAVYLLAQRPGGGTLVGGPQKFCTAATAFEIQGNGDCARRGYAEAGFARTGTRGLAGYTAHIGKSGLILSRP